MLQTKGVKLGISKIANYNSSWKKIENLNLTTDVTFPDHKYCRRHLLLQVHKSAFSHKIYVENKIIFSCENFTPNVL